MPCIRNLRPKLAAKPIAAPASAAPTSAPLLFVAPAKRRCRRCLLRCCVARPLPARRLRVLCCLSCGSGCASPWRSSVWVRGFNGRAAAPFLCRAAIRRRLSAYCGGGGLGRRRRLGGGRLGQRLSDIRVRRRLVDQRLARRRRQFLDHLLERRQRPRRLIFLARQLGRRLARRRRLVLRRRDALVDAGVEPVARDHADARRDRPAIAPGEALGRRSRRASWAAAAPRRCAPPRCGSWRSRHGRNSAATRH